MTTDSTVSPLSSVTAIGRNVLEAEASSILATAASIDSSFEKAVKTLLTVSGRVVVTGMGKPGYIARKISATFSSTGTPSFYLHPAEAIHGDLGMVTSRDAIIVLSNSGETAEIINILPTLKRIGLPIIALCGSRHSTLASHSDIVISSAVETEACPLNLAPTNSTTVALALGDALAVAVMTLRDFSRDNFAFYHPGGTLGRKLLLTVGKVMRTGESACLIERNCTILDALFLMTRHRSGAAIVVDPQGAPEGILTDGDIRRYVMYNNLFLQNPVTDIMNTTPVTVYEDQLIDDAIRIMEQHAPGVITVLPVQDRHSRVTGLIHLTDLLKKRLF